jgi:hypothetical protein
MDGRHPGQDDRANAKSVLKQFDQGFLAVDPGSRGNATRDIVHPQADHGDIVRA